MNDRKNGETTGIENEIEEINFLFEYERKNLVFLLNSFERLFMEKYLSPSYFPLNQVFTCEDFEGYTPLGVAVQNNWLHAAKELLLDGADPLYKDSFAKIPLHYCESGSDMYNLLCESIDC